MESIGKYKILGKIGAGNMGVVYKAMDPRMKRIVAVKTMSAKIDSEPDLRNRFFREAEAAAQLSHKNIITVYEMDEDDGRIYLAMEFLEGHDLKDVISRRDPMPLERKLQLISEICAGLSHAHKKGIVHRDIKPSNVFVTDTGEVKILDFGLARVVTSDLTGTGAQMGTPAYMSPEQVQSAKVDHRSDIYSAGVVFYELLSYNKAFHGDSLPAIFYKIIQVDPEPLKSLDPRIPAEISDIVQRAIAKDPNNRYQHMDDLIEELEELRHSLEDRKRVLTDQAREAMGKLEKLIRENREMLKDAAEKLEKLHQESPTLVKGLAPGGGTETSGKRKGFALSYLDLLEVCEGAKRDYERLTALLVKRKVSSSILAEAVSLEKKGRLDMALHSIEALLREDPSFADAVSLHRQIRAELEERRLKEEKAAEAERLFKEAQSSFASGDLTSCITTLAEVLTLQPGQAAATILLERAQERIRIQAELEEKRRRSEIELEAVRKALEVGYFAQARAAAMRALEISPDAPAVRGLLDEIESAQKAHEAELERERRINNLLEEARGLQKAGEDKKAIARLSELLALQPDHVAAIDLKDKIERLRKLRTESEDRYRKALDKYSADDLTGALPLLTEALKLYPAHHAALDLLQEAKKKIQERAELEERRRQAEEALAHARRALAAGDLEKAREVLYRALQTHPDAPGAPALTADLERAEEERRLREEREREVLRLLGEAQAHQKTGREDEALKTLDQVLNLEPGHPHALERKDSIIEARGARERVLKERNARIAKSFRLAEDAEKQGDLRTARDLAHGVLAEDAGHAGARALLARIESRIQAEELISKIQSEIANSEQALKKDNYKQAAEHAETALRLDPNNFEAKDLLRRIEQARDQKRKRGEISSLLAQSQQALDNEELDRAAELARKVLSLNPQNSDASGLLNRIAKAEEEKRRRGRIAGLLAEARQFKGKKELDEAVRKVREVLGLDSANKEAAALQKELERDLRAREREREKEAKKLEETIVTAPPIDSTATPQEQTIIIPEAAKPVAGVPRIVLYAGAGVLAVTILVLALLWMQTGNGPSIEEELAQAQSFLQQKQFNKAIEIARKFPDNAAAKSVLAQAEREQSIENDMSEARALREKARVEEGQAKIDRLYDSKARIQKVIDREPSYQPAVQLLAELQKEIDALLSGQSAQQQEQLLNDWVAKAERLLKAGNLAEAKAEIAKVLQRRSDHPKALETDRLLNQQLAKARTDAETNQNVTAQAREAAEKAGAASNAPASFREAKGLEGEGLDLMRSQRYGEAARKFNQAGNVYRRSEKEARDNAQLAQQDRQRAEAKAGADTAQKSVEQARDVADKAGAASLAQKTYQEARGLESEAVSLFSSQRYGDAAKKFSQAGDAYRRAEKDARDNAQLAQQDRQRAEARNAAETAQRTLEQAREAADKAGATSQAQKTYQEAKGLESEAVSLFSSQRFGDAAKKFTQAGELYRAAEREAREKGRGPSDRDEILKALQTYQAAFQRMDLDLLRRIWPRMPKRWEDSLRNTFARAKSMEADLQRLSEPQISADRASIVCRSVSTITDKDGKRYPPNPVTYNFTLTKTGGQWVIEDVVPVNR